MTSCRHYLALLAFLLPLTAWAAGPTITGVENASAYTTTGTVSIYGGVAGDNCSGENPGSTCNSCQSAYLTSCTNPPLCPCNSQRIYDSLVVRIDTQRPDSSRHNIIATASTSTSTSTTVINPNTLNNGGDFIDFTWAQICNLIDNTVSSCENIAASNTVTLHLYIDANDNNQVDSSETSTDVVFKVLKPDATAYAEETPATPQGIYSFIPYPGDEKIYLTSVLTASGFPILPYGGTKATKVRVFVSDSSLTNANATSPYTPKDLDVDPDGNDLQTNIVDGLANDTSYYFRIGLVDEAQNVVLYYPDKATADGLTDCTTSPNPSTCAFAATPDQVLGLLTKDMNCFIATAAYGSIMAPKIQTFRDFRNRYLIPSEYGLKFVRMYYKYGPYAARYIADKPALRAVTRAALWPLWGLSYIAVKFGLSYALAFTLLLLSSLILLPWYGFKRVSTRE